MLLGLVSMGYFTSGVQVNEMTNWLSQEVHLNKKLGEFPEQKSLQPFNACNKTAA